MTGREVGRTGLRKLLQRTGLVEESTRPLPTDPAEVVELLAAPWYDQRLIGLADELGRDPDSVRAEAAGYLREIKSSIILQPGPAALTDGVRAIQQVIEEWAGIADG